MTEDKPLPLTIAPAEVIREGSLTEYNRHMEIFHKQLEWLNLNLAICKRIAAFPADLFEVGPSQDNVFLLWTFFNTYRVAGLLITRLITDQVSGASTLLHFRDLLFTELIRPEYLRALAARLKAHKFDSNRDAVLMKIRAYREGDSARFVPEPTLVASSLADLRDTTQRVNALFDAVCFDTEYHLLPVEYEGDRSDLDRILDAVAKTSSILNSPELSPDRWAYTKAYSINAENLAHINRYRRKLKLPEV